MMLIVSTILVIISGVETNPGPQCQLSGCLNSSFTNQDAHIEMLTSLQELLRCGNSFMKKQWQLQLQLLYVRDALKIEIINREQISLRTLYFKEIKTVIQ